MASELSCQFFSCHAAGENCIAFDGMGRHVVSCGSDGVVKIFTGGNLESASNEILESNCGMTCLYIDSNEVLYIGDEERYVKKFTFPEVTRDGKGDKECKFLDLLYFFTKFF